MNQYKIYFIAKGYSDLAFVDADSAQQAVWKILSRFNYAIIQNIVAL